MFVSGVITGLGASRAACLWLLQPWIVSTRAALAKRGETPGR
ncbi:hypothetical protein SAMN05444581_12726 [Methylocapsa palsarum]|uniref:Uncharacterized protein n=1 Tax=Methylocapsa palsarum TaxID=1612308 RepID=A0A1I4CQJ6_9HYPH|nr:hypothetical protein SAMN05444581_12726 [Methylocapsa palsarum]